MDIKVDVDIKVDEDVEVEVDEGLAFVFLVYARATHMFGEPVTHVTCVARWYGRASAVGVGLPEAVEPEQPQQQAHRGRRLRVQDRERHSLVHSASHS